MLNVCLNGYDPYFGALSKNLQAEHCKREEIEQAKKDLSEAIQGKREITPKIKELYRKTDPIDLEQKILSIKKEAIDFGFETALGILEAPSCLTGKWDPEFKNFTTILNSFIEKRVDALVKLGKVEALEKYMNIIYEEFQIPEEEIIKSFTTQIFEEFSHGYPTACSAVSTFLKVEIKNNTNPNSAKHLLITLQRLANLGNAIAQTELRNILYLEESISTNTLQLSCKERIEGLKQLALSGHLSSQLSLIQIYKSYLQTNSLGGISSAKKRKIIRQLIKNENTRSQTFVKIIEFDRSQSLLNRIQILSTHSQKGCLDSFNCLFGAYVNNRLHEEKLSLSKEERLAKLHELKMMNPAIWNENFVRINLRSTNGFDNEKDLLQSDLSYDKFFAWLEKQGLEA